MQKLYTQSDSTGASMDLIPRYILKLSHQRVALDLRPSLISMIRLLVSYCTSTVSVNLSHLH